MVKRATLGKKYLFDPNLMDQFMGHGEVRNGDVVTVVQLPGAPPPNTMGMAHVRTADGRYGLVDVGSLESLNKRPARGPLGLGLLR